MNLSDVLRARARIAPYLRRTPLVPSPWLSELAGTRVSLKVESLQLSSSFKSRGAFNAVIARIERGLAPGARLVTASAGNHGRALAEAARTFHLPLMVFAPSNAAATKLHAIRRLGADLNTEAPDYDAAEQLAKAYAVSQEAAFISPYNDPDVVAGGGTVALEIFEDAPSTALLVSPIGGGGLISGVAIAAKSLSPRCEVVGVEAEASAAFQAAVQAGRIVEIAPRPTLADGLGGNVDPQTITFGFIRDFVDRIVTVSEEELSAAIRGLVEFEHLIAEGAGAAATAALVGRRIQPAGRDTVVLLTGSNIDLERLSSLILPNATTAPPPR